MFNNKQELLAKIRLSEDSLLELKEVGLKGRRVVDPHRNSLADELAAFANAHGGVCLLGVRDKPREVIGIPEDGVAAVEAFVRDICHVSIDPPLAPLIECFTLPNADGVEVPVVKVDVPTSLFVHRSPGGYRHRIGSSKPAMSTEYLARMFQQRSQTRIVRFDEQVVAGASLDDLSSQYWKRFRTERTGDSRDGLLAKLHMATTDVDGILKPTVAGLLMAAEDPREWMPNAFVQAVAYRGTEIRTSGMDAPYQLDAADLSGPLDCQVVDACHFVAKNMRIEAFKDMGRLDRPQFDMAAVFEAIVNAVAHRDYAVYGSKVRLKLFENRLELYSPGGLPNTLEVESLPHVQASRNETLTSLLGKCPVPDKPWLTTNRQTMMDRRGEGVPIILENSKRLSGKEPEYRVFDRAELRLTIYAASGHGPTADAGH